MNLTGQSIRLHKRHATPRDARSESNLKFVNDTASGVDPTQTERRMCVWYYESRMGWTQGSRTVEITEAPASHEERVRLRLDAHDMVYRIERVRRQEFRFSWSRLYGSRPRFFRAYPTRALSATSAL